MQVDLPEVLTEVTAQFARHRLVREPDHSLQDLQFLRQTEGPAVGQSAVVEVLGRKAQRGLEHLLWIEDLGQVNEANLPGDA